MSTMMTILVKPRSRVSALERGADGGWTARLRAPPVDGRANQELIGLVAREFGCAKSAVAIKSGASGRVKRVMIAQ